jgi:acetyl esterase/lipase
VSRRIVEQSPASAADARLRYGDHRSQFVDFRYPAADGVHPLFVYVHGGFWRARIDLTHGGHICSALAAAGFATVNIEYRRVGEEGGGWPGTIDDVRRALIFARDHAAEFRGEASRAVVAGHSAGGHLALCMAAGFADLRRVIACGPVADPRRAWELNLGDGAAAAFFGGSPDEFPERYLMRAPGCPTVIIHGVDDEVVPVALSRGYPGARLIEIAGADHFDPVDPESAYFAETLRTIVES